MNKPVKRFILYFHKFGEADWVIKVYGQQARLTRDWRSAVELRPWIRKRQPRAVLTGRGRVSYSRQMTRIT